MSAGGAATSGAPLVLEARGLRKGFRSGSEVVRVLEAADLDVAAGSTVSIRGESGSGKTTLLNLLAGLERADGGELAWEGRVVDAGRGAELAARRARFVGLVFQSFHLVPEMDARENLLLAARIAGRCGPEERERAADLLERVGLGARQRHLPGRMSGGERQRVALARALMNRPRVILADEPTGNLDEDTAARVMDLLVSLSAETGTALVLVTHNREHARRCREHFHLHHGRLAVDDQGGGVRGGGPGG